MRKGRTLLYGGALGAALGVLLAPRRGESRRLALTRLRLALGSGGGSLRAFAGTPCSTAGPTSAQAERAVRAECEGQEAEGSTHDGAPR